jgi:multidrug efflux pump subunit AcrA (membrane-fusion protein)
MKTEAIESLKLLKKNTSLKKVGFSSFFVFIFFILFFLFMPWQQTAFCTGNVIAYSPTERQQNISALVEGRIGKWFVEEGMSVKKGEKIVEIYDNDPAIIQNLVNEKKSLTERLKAINNAAKISNLNITRQTSLYEKGISAKKTVEAAQIEYQKLVAEEASIRATLSQIEIRLSRQAGQLVVAPMDGIILRRMSGEGSTLVKAGDVLATLVPETRERSVALWVSGNDLPLIHPGQHVRIQFEGWPAIQFSGWPSVAVGTFGGIVQVVDSADDSKGRFRILVSQDPKEPWPESKYLRQGVKAHGWVLLGKVKIWYELWRQFNGFPPSVQEEPK